MVRAERQLTQQQEAVFHLVAHYHEAVGEPAPASYIARKLSITKTRVQAYFRTLNELGWLRSPGSPAVPTKPGGLSKRQLGSVSRAGHAANVSTAAQPRVVDFPPLDLRAAIVPSSLNDEERTVDVVFTTTAPVERYEWLSDTRYLEVLSMDPKAVRLDRFNSGAPLLDSHSDYSVSDILGVVVQGSASLTKNELRGTVRFSKRPEVEPIYQDVRDGIVTSLSIGYRVYKFEEQAGNGNKLPIRKAIDWEPYEASMVPIPADAKAKVREKGGAPNRCEIVPEPAASAANQETRKMNDGTSETIVQPQPFAPGPPTPPAPVEATESELAVQVERERAEGILLACRGASLPGSWAQKWIKEGVSLLEARGRALAEVEKRGLPENGPKCGPPDIRVGDDPLVHVRAGIENALLNRVAPPWEHGTRKGGFALTEEGRQYRGMSLMRIAEAYLQARGARTTSMSALSLAGAALNIEGLTQRTGFHTTSDFPVLLADVARKTLRAAYAEAPQTFSLIARRVTLADFKQTNRVQIGDAPALLEVGEHGEFQRGTVVEGKEVVQLKTYGRIFAITRQALINDDTDAFSRMAAGFGRQARALESDLAWAQITSNPTMGDGNALFSVAHNNLAAAGTAIDVTSLGTARAAMRVQKGIDASTPLNVNPRYLITPAAKETLAAQYLTQITPQQGTNVNPFAGLLTAIVEPRLDVNSATAWYMAADPSDVDVLEIATLEGAEGGPMVETEIGFEVDGLQIKARHDVAAKVIDWRGLYKNPGV